MAWLTIITTLPPHACDDTGYRIKEHQEAKVGTKAGTSFRFLGESLQETSALVWAPSRPRSPDSASSRRQQKPPHMSRARTVRFGAAAETLTEDAVSPGLLTPATDVPPSKIGHSDL